MTSTTDYLVIDKNGKRARRSGVLLDGDTMTTPARFMDHASPELQAAMAAAESARRVEQFDANTFVGHRPGFAIIDAAAQDASVALRNARDKRLADAWKHPPAVVDQTQATMPVPPATPPASFAAARPAMPMAEAEAKRLAARQGRDQRISAAWKR